MGVPSSIHGVYHCSICLLMHKTQPDKKSDERKSRKCLSLGNVGMQEKLEVGRLIWPLTLGQIVTRGKKNKFCQTLFEGRVGWHPLDQLIRTDIRVSISCAILLCLRCNFRLTQLTDSFYHQKTGFQSQVGSWTPKTIMIKHRVRDCSCVGCMWCESPLLLHLSHKYQGWHLQ